MLQKQKKFWLTDMRAIKSRDRELVYGHTCWRIKPFYILNGDDCHKAYKANLFPSKWTGRIKKAPLVPMLEDRTGSPLSSDTDPCISIFSIVLCLCVCFSYVDHPYKQSVDFSEILASKKGKRGLYLWLCLI